MRTIAIHETCFFNLWHGRTVHLLWDRSYEEPQPKREPSATSRSLYGPDRTPELKPPAIGEIIILIADWKAKGSLLAMGKEMRCEVVSTSTNLVQMIGLQTRLLVNGNHDYEPILVRNSPFHVAEITLRIRIIEKSEQAIGRKKIV